MSGNPISNASLTGATTISGSVNFAAGTQISGLYKRYVGLGLVDNTSDMDKPVSTAVQTALGNIIGNAAVLASRDALDTLSEISEAVNSAGTKIYALDNALALKAPSANPVFTGSIRIPAMTGFLKSSESGIVGSLVQTTDIAVGAISKTFVGLENVDNTSDVNKPVSTAMQTALTSKAPSASPTFTGTVKLPTGAGIIKSDATGQLSSSLIGTTDITDGSITAAKIANGVSLQGPTGPAGTNGTNGTNGVNGATIISATAVNNSGTVTITFTKSDSTTFTCDFVV